MNELSPSVLKDLMLYEDTCILESREEEESEGKKIYIEREIEREGERYGKRKIDRYVEIYKDI